MLGLLSLPAALPLAGKTLSFLLPLLSLLTYPPDMYPDDLKARQGGQGQWAGGRGGAGDGSGVGWMRGVGCGELNAVWCATGAWAGSAGSTPHQAAGCWAVCLAFRLCTACSYLMPVAYLTASPCRLGCLPGCVQGPQALVVVPTRELGVQVSPLLQTLPAAATSAGAHSASTES